MRMPRIPQLTQGCLPFEPEVGVLRPPHLVSRAWEGFQATEPGRQLGAVLALLPDSWRPAVIGGVIRDLRLRSSRNRAIVDIDLVIGNCPTSEDLNAVLKPYVVATNSFGGLKCRLGPKGYVFDLWRIEDHQTVSSGPAPRSLEELLPHCVTNLDAVALDPSSGYLYEFGFCDALLRREIDLIGRPSPRRESALAQAVHLVLLLQKYQREFAVSDRIWQYLGQLMLASDAMAIKARVAEKLVERKSRRAPQVLSEFELIMRRATETRELGEEPPLVLFG